MSKMRSLPLRAALCAALCIPSIALLSSFAAAQSPAPAARIVTRIDENQLVSLKGNVHPLANSQNDRGPVSSSLPMSDLILVLSRSAEQQAAFDAYLASEYDQNSPNFHQWLTPDEVGTRFGPSQADIATISNWLTGQGFVVNEVAKDHMSIRFSGVAGQVQSAFHTQIHNLVVKGVPHIANMSDPQIPAALAPVVVGIKALHNFFPKPLHRMGSQVQRDASTGQWKRVSSATGTSKSARPQFATTDQYGDLLEDVGPYDFATIYNVLPLWNSSTPIDGTGQTIAIAGTSDINPSDVSAFRQDFGLPTSNAANTPKQIMGANGQDPGICTSTSPTAVCTIDDLIENTLDVEWSGSIAKNAQIILVTSGSKSSTDDTVYDSANYVVTNKTASILNVSYGECELYEGTAGNVGYYNLWQTAASEGISVFVAAGDSGSATCDDGLDATLPYAAEHGLSVSGLASTPFNTAVGGTDLYWCPESATSCTSSAAQYWNTSNSSMAAGQSNAKGYVPEVPWNDTCASPFGLQILQIISSYIGVSGVNDAEYGCNFAASSTYENYVNYYLGYDMSYLVDIVGGSGGASGCVVNSSTDTTAGTCNTGATSTGSSNGNLPLYNNGWVKPTWQAGVPGIPSDGVRDIPDVSFFAADGFLGSAYLVCVSEVSACTYSANAEPFAQEVGGTSVATPAMAGVMALINQKTGSTQGFANKELYTLATKQTYSGCSAESVTASSSSCYFNDIDGGTFTPPYNNAVPCDYSSGSPNCAILHSGDTVGILGASAGNPGYNATTGYDLATGLGSLNVANVVNNWTSTIGTGAATVTVAPSPASIAVNQSLSVVVTVASKSNGGTTPTGSVTLSSGTYTSPTESLSSGTYTFTVPAGSLSGGTDTLTVSYGGDSNYAPSSGTGSVTVTKLTASVSATPSATAINSNLTLTVTGTVTGSGATPTGTVYVTSGTYTSSSSTLSSGSYSITINPNSLPGGTDALAVQYSGDANYSATSGSTSVVVTAVVVQTPTVAVTPASSTVDSGSPLLVTVTVTGSNGTPTGSVTLTANGDTLTAVNLTGGVAQFTIPANTLASSPTTTVSNTTTAHYQGDPNYNQANGTATVTVTQSGYSLSAPAATPNPVTPGSAATTSVSVNSTTDFTGTVTFTSASCVLTGFPTGVTASTPGNPSCALTGNGTVTMTNGAASGPVTYTVSTTSTTTAFLADRPRLGGMGRDLQLAKTSSPSNLRDLHASGSGWFGAASGAGLAALFLFLVPGGSRKWRKMLSMMLLIAAVSFVTVGCGGGGGTGSTGSTPGTPTVAVTVTPSSVTLGSSSNVAVQVTVTGSSGTPTGSVSFSGGGYVSASEALTSGAYTYSIPASSFKTVGSDTLTASYSGDSNYTSGSGTATLTVNNVPTTAGTYTFTVTPTSNPPFAAQPSTTFTVTVN